MRTIGLILAGGQSSRFQGNDKSWILWQGKALIQHVIDRIKPQVDDIIISANRELERYNSLGYPVIPDDSEIFMGPLAGILAGMNHIIRETINTENTQLLTVPCDMPLIPTNLIAMLSKDSADNLVRVVEDDKRLQPLVALIPIRFKSQLESYLQTGHFKVETWILSLQPKIVNLSKFSDSFCNINDKSALDSLPSLK